MTAPDPLAPIRARAEAATAGPWEPYLVKMSPEVSEWIVDSEPTFICSTHFNDTRCENDAEFIAAARTDIPALLAALDSVMALAEKWRYKGEFGWGPWQEGYGPDPEGHVLDCASAELRAAVSAALGGGE